MLARVVTVIARVCTRLACTHLHLPRPACTLTKAPPSPPCPVASLARGIVIRVPSKSFSTARKNRRLQNLSHPACATRPPSCAPAHAPPSSHRRLQWPSASCTCTSAMHERDRPGGYGGRHRHCSPPPGLLPFTREEAFEAFVVRPALSKFRIRRPLINRANRRYQLCGDGPGAVLSRTRTGVLTQRNMEKEADCCLLRL